MFGCDSLAAVRASRMKRSRTSALFANVSGRTLIATGRSSLRSMPRYTTPMPPRPISRSMAKSGDNDRESAVSSEVLSAIHVKNEKGGCQQVLFIARWDRHNSRQFIDHLVNALARFHVGLSNVAVGGYVSRVRRGACVITPAGPREWPPDTPPLLRQPFDIAARSLTSGADARETSLESTAHR